MKIKAFITFLLIAGVLIRASIAFSAQATYTYDELDRLIQVSYNDGTVINYTYDEIGNRTSTVVRTNVDTTKPTVTGFTIPATSTSLTVPVTTFTATDNIGVTGYLITESSTPPLSGAAGWTAAAPVSYIAAAAGSHILYPWAKDAAGNVSAVFAAPRTVVITSSDTTKPIVSGFTIPATSASLTVPVTTFTATDNIGVTGYLITESSTPPLPGAAGWTAAAPVSYTAATTGSHILYPWAKDAAGNVSAPFATPRTVVITSSDTIMPIVTGFTIPATSTSLTVPVTTFTATDNIGVTGYLITESSSPPYPSGGWPAAAPSSYTAATAGSHILCPWVKDAAGNVSAAFATPRTVVITVPDTTKPIVSAFTIPATSASLTVPVTSFYATDNIGVTGYLITETNDPPVPIVAGWTAAAPASYTAAAAGSHILYPWAKDAAGNVSTAFATPRTVVIDINKPSVTLFKIPGVWRDSLSVPIYYFNASDNIGVTGYLITQSSTPPLPSAAGWTATAPVSYKAAAEGTYFLYPWVKDAAGNVSVLYGLADVLVDLIDTTKPTVTSFLIPATSASLSVPISSFIATDNIGVTGYVITESSTPPLPGGTAAPWMDARPVSYTAATAGSHILYPWAKDFDGNVSAPFATPRTVVIDTTKPYVYEFTMPANAGGLSVPVYRFRASDNIGVTGCLITESSTPPLPSAAGWTAGIPTSYNAATGGSHTLYPWVKDAVGNVSAPFATPRTVYFYYW